jgi:valyl-tRNA synthetase
MLGIEDIMVRFARMRGKKTLWLPGTDHAAIATQSKVEKELSKKKIRRHDLGREKFLEEVNNFAMDSQSTILSQVKKMGSSVDWSRLAFTLDETRGKAVNKAFKEMYEAGLIYREHRIVNWDVKGQTVVSDDEVVHEPRKGKMYTFKYSEDFPFPIATTRPETKLGDTAVAVHPDDARYKEYIGKEYSFEFAGEPVTVKIVADEEVDPEFGVGALGVTPAHSITDWEIAKRHDLPVKQVINEYGKMTVGMEGVKDVKVAAAREAIAEWLEKEGLLISSEELDQNVGTAERTGGVIEPLPKLQWWIDTDKKFPFKTDKIEGIEKGQEVSLKEIMLHVVKSGQVNMLPEKFERIYFDWINKLRPWNISRQIWYGHRVPVWYKGDEIHVGESAPDGDWTQDEDTLDTWFSSGLWTFSTLLDGENEKETILEWLEASKDRIFHPTNVLETGGDIIFFWVARMILMTTFFLGEIPFDTAYFHGLVRDGKGQKISKSLGNNIDPVEIIEQHGADALRMALIIGTAPGMDSKLGDDKIKAYRKFSNKIWNATRFVLENTDGFDMSSKPELETDHQNFITMWEELVKEITKEMEEYKFYLVGEKLYHFFWHTFADVVIEKLKGDMSDSAKYTLLHLLKEQLKALHPFMPFITEEIWQNLPDTDGKLLMIESWPQA